MRLEVDFELDLRSEIGTLLTVETYSHERLRFDWHLLDTVLHRSSLG